MKLGSWLKRNGKRGYRWSLFLMSGATALVVAACDGMADTMGISYSNSAQYIFADNCNGCHSDPDHNVSQSEANELYDWIVGNGAQQY